MDPFACQVVSTDLSKTSSLQLGSPIQVLLVEDNPEAARLIRRHIREGGDSHFHVEWKDNLLDAISRLVQPGIDVVLLDLGMPESSGYETHLAINSVVGKTVPVIILTSDDRASTRDRSIRLGAVGYLVKHRTTSAELRQTLHEAVATASTTAWPPWINGGDQET